MIDWGDPENLWILTNRCLGAVVLVSGLVIARDILKAVRLQFRPDFMAAKAARAEPLDDHTFLVPDLGLTMADGGQRTDPPGSPAPKAEK